MHYKGIKIYDKVIIVEKTSTTEGGYNWRGRTVNQGYVVDINNAKMLENAKSWAEWIKYPESEEFFGKGKRYWSEDVTKEQRKAYDDAKIEMPGIVHEYENGKFTITLDEAAGWSSQGGKLSFWNCIITAPDGHNFLVGINSELLLHLMMTTTLVKGVCQEKVWLGRIKGTQVGVFTSEMDDFKQAKLDEEARNLKKTSNYKPGDIVETLTSKELYIGEVYLYANVYNRGGHYCVRNPAVVFNKPKKMHAFISFPVSTTYEHLYPTWIWLKSSKPKKIVTGHDDKEMFKYRDMIEKYPSEYSKLQGDLGLELCFRYFENNMAIRLTGDISPSQVKKDICDALKYRNSQNTGNNITRKVWLQSELEQDTLCDFKSWEVDKYDAFDGFCLYKIYYKK